MLPSLRGCTALAGIALLLTACASPAPAATATATPTAMPTPAPAATAAPDYVQVIGAERGVPRRLLVWDRAGLLAGVSDADVVWGPTTGITWHPVREDPDSLILEWFGGACAGDPSLTMTIEGSKTVLSLDDGHFDPASVSACPAIGIYHEVELSFHEPVASFDFMLRLTPAS